jgi:hypothetical protein
MICVTRGKIFCKNSVFLCLYDEFILYRFKPFPHFYRKGNKFSHLSGKYKKF